MEVAQTPKRAVSLASRLRSPRPQQGEPEVPGVWTGGLVMAALPPYRAAVLVRQFLAVRQPAAQSPYQVLRLVVTAAPASGPAGTGASVSLISNGGVNDAIGGATSGTLNLTQTAIGGNGGDFGNGPGGNATSILIGTNPFGASTYNLTANATGGNGGNFSSGVRSGGSATATADASASKVGIANATAIATGGDTVGSSGIGFAGAATANASATNGGSAVAQATGGNGPDGQLGPVIFGPASATATSTAMLGGTANATAIATGGPGFF